MTTTMARPAPSPSPASQTPAAGRPPPTLARPADATATATVALTVLTLSVAVGFARLFDSAGFMGPVVATALGVHAVAWIARRLGIPTLVAGLVSMAAAAVVIAWSIFPDSTAYGIPWKGSLSAARVALEQARVAFSDVAAPTTVQAGFVLAACLGVAICAFMADWAAFRVGTPLEACLPAFTLFLFTSALAAPRHRALAVVAFSGTALAFFLVHQISLGSRAGTWFGNRRTAGQGAMFRAAAVIATAAAVIGLVVGPALPGAGTDPVVAYRGKDRIAGKSSRTTVSPLVDIRTRLVDRRGNEVFRVVANERAYWRLTSLDTFNGQIWSSNDTYHATRGGLPSDVDVDIGGTSVEQTFTIASLSTIWLPHAYRPVRVRGAAGVSYNAATGSLITEQDTADGLEYDVVSRVIDTGLTAASLKTAPAVAPAEVRERFLALPPLPRRVVELAQEVTRGATTQYDKARRLQDFFRQRFRYSLEVDNGHDNRALERFLYETRAGYCEQFAGAYAVMARVINLPVRVAVGFTPGQQIDEGTYVVRDLNAHAWPEVYLDGYGWVAFEPTPGRGAPSAQAYTGVEEAQDNTPLENATQAPTTSAAPTAPGETTTSLPDFTGEDVDSGENTEPVPLGRRVLYMLAVLLLAGSLAWAAGVPALRAHQRHQRRASAATAAERVMVAWMETAEILGQAGAVKRPAETLMEYARRAARVVGLPTDTATALRGLANHAAAASYGAVEPPDHVAQGAAETASAVRRAVTASASTSQRVLWELDPRPLAPSRR